MKTTKIFKTIMFVLVLAFTGACADVATMQAREKEIAAKDAQQDSDLQEVRRIAEQALDQARSAMETAAQAQSEAEAANSCCSDNKERLDRMFEKAMSK